MKDKKRSMPNGLKRRNNKKNSKERVKAKLPEEVMGICLQCGVNLYEKEKLPRMIVNEKGETKGSIRKWGIGCPDFKRCAQPFKSLNSSPFLRISNREYN